jgi:hypothetical protein
MQERPGSYRGPERGDGGKRGEKAQIIFSFRHKLSNNNKGGVLHHIVYSGRLYGLPSLSGMFLKKKALKRICRPWLTGSDTRVHKNSLHKVNFLFQEILRADEKFTKTRQQQQKKRYWWVVWQSRKTGRHNMAIIGQPRKRLNQLTLLNSFRERNKWDIDFFFFSFSLHRKKLLRRVVFTLSTSSDSNNDDSHNK